MRYLIESEWANGIKIILKSEVTHNIIRALSSDERSFLVENMIGEVFTLSNQEISDTL